MQGHGKRDGSPSLSEEISEEELSLISISLILLLKGLLPPNSRYSMWSILFYCLLRHSQTSSKMSNWDATLGSIPKPLPNTIIMPNLVENYAHFVRVLLLFQDLHD